MLFEDTWRTHILNAETGHPEIESYLEMVLAAISKPDYHEADIRPARERFYKHDAGPSAWLIAVVSYEAEPARIVTAFAFGERRAPGGRS